MREKKKGVTGKAAIAAAILLILSISASSVTDSDITVILLKDKQSVDLNDNINFVISTKISGIMVLSVPTQLQVYEPDGIEKTITLESSYDGSYRGSFKPTKLGEHRLKASVLVDDVEKVVDDQFMVSRPGLSINVTNPSVFYYMSGPVEITGEINITDEGMPVTKEAEILLSSVNSPFFAPLCRVNCQGSCSFSCPLSQNIEIAEYELLVRIVHNNNYFSQKSAFEIQFLNNDDLKLNISFRDGLFINETQHFTIVAELKDMAFTGATANIRLVDPRGLVSNIYADEAVPGLYTSGFQPRWEGEYRLNIFIVRGGIYGSRAGSFDVGLKPHIIRVENYSIVHDNKNRTWLFCGIPLSRDHGEHFLDITPAIEKHIINISDMHIIYNGTREKAVISDQGIAVRDSSHGIVYLEARVIDETSVPFEISAVSSRNRIDIANGQGEKRIELDLPVNSTVKWVLDEVFSGIESWGIADGKMIVYMDDGAHVYLRDNKPLLDGVGFNKELLVQGDSLVISPLSNLTPGYMIRIYYPNSTMAGEYNSSGDFILNTGEGMPFGKYHVEIEAYLGRLSDISLSSFHLRSARPIISFTPNLTATAERGSSVDFLHTLTNENYKDTDTINLIVRSNSSTVKLFDFMTSEELKDTDRDGKIDTGELGPGESISILCTVGINPSIGIGVNEFVRITGVSSLDPQVTASIADIIKINAFSFEEITPEDISVTGIELIDNKAIVKIHNKGKTDREAALNVTFYHEDRSESYIRNLFVGGGQAGAVAIEKDFVSESFSVMASILNTTGHMDSNPANDYRTFHSSTYWGSTLHHFRIPLVFKERLGRMHKSFVISSYVRLPNSTDNTSFRIEYFDGKRNREGRVKVLQWNGDSASIISEFEDIMPNIDATAYLYFSVNSSLGINYSDITNELVLNNKDGTEAGRWVTDSQIPGYLGKDYLHDLNMEKGYKHVSFAPQLPGDSYEVYLYYPSAENLADNVPVIIEGMDSIQFTEVNERMSGGTWNYIGAFDLDEASSLRIENFGTRGLVVVDAVKFRRISHYSIHGDTEELRGKKVVKMDGTTVLDQENKVFEFVIFENSTLTLNMSQYLDYLTYISFNHSSDLDIEFNEGVSRITPYPGFVGKGTVMFTDQYRTVMFIIDVRPARAPALPEKEGNATALEEKPSAAVQGQAVIGEPVVWKMSVSSNESFSLVLPGEARNISVKNEEDALDVNLSVSGKMLNLSMLERIEEIESFVPNISDPIDAFSQYVRLQKESAELGDIRLDDPKSLEIPENSNITVVFTTEPPVKEESIVMEEEFTLRKNVTIKSDSDVHYVNVLSYTDIIPSKREQVHLFWNDNGVKRDVVDDPRFNVSLHDTDDDGLYDRITWITPHLSEEEFEVVIDLTVLNIQSYPSLFRNWTVYFNTTGRANLTITAINGTSWAELLRDDGDTRNDLVFEGIECDGNSIKDSLKVITGTGQKVLFSDLTEDANLSIKSLFIENYECNGTAQLADMIITTGKHHLMFEFGNDVAYANNLGSLIYEDFESYANNTNATGWVDYSNMITHTISESFKVVANSTNKVDRGDTGGSGRRYSIYNLSSAFRWKEYQIQLRMRLSQNYTSGSWAMGVFFYYDNTDYNSIIYEKASSPGWEISSSEFWGQPDNPVGWQSTVKPAIGVWQYMKIKVNQSGTNTTIRAKIWNSTQTEPTTWTLRGDDEDMHNTNGTIGLYVRDGVLEVDDIIVENMTSDPVITIISPLAATYNVGEQIWFNISLDKTGNNCSYKIGSQIWNMSRLNFTQYYSNRSFPTYGERTVYFYCDDSFGNRGNASRAFTVGSGAITIVSPPNATITDHAPLLDAVFNDTYDAWYQIDGGANSTRYTNTANITKEVGPLTQDTHTIAVFINNSGSIEYDEVSFAIDIPIPSPSITIDSGNPKYTPDTLVDLAIYGDNVFWYRFSYNETAWTSWQLSSGSSPSWKYNFNITNTTLGCNGLVGTKTVYAQARNYYNETSATFSDTIIYDPTTLSGSQFYDNFNTTVYVNESNDVMYNVTEEGGVKLNATCQNYTFEGGCWMYRRKVTLTEIDGRGHTNYTFDVSFDSRDLVSDQKLQGDCDDFRVTRVNPGTGQQERMYFWDEENYCNSSKTRVWMKTAQLNDSQSQVFYLYYGNPGASRSTYRNGNYTFGFFDDFNGGAVITSKWDEVTLGYNFPAGVGYIEYWNTAGNRPSLATDRNYTNGTMVWRMRTGDVDADFDGSVAAREQDLDLTAEGYYFRLDNLNAADNAIVRPAVPTYIAQHTGTVPQDIWVRAYASFSGANLEFYDDSHLATISGSDTLYNSGKIALLGDSDSGGATNRARLDWILYVNRSYDMHTAVLDSEEVEYAPAGNITSFVIKPAALDAWKYLIVNHDIPDDTNITYSILDETNNPICVFETADAITEYDISGCAFGYERIKVHAELTTNNNTVTPLIEDWNISWMPDNYVVMDEPDEIFQTRYTAFFANGSVYSDTDNCTLYVYSQYKLLGQSMQFIEDDYSDFSTYTSLSNVAISDQLTLKPNTTTSTWYDQDWPYRIKVNISVTESKTDFPIKITFTSSQVNFTKTQNFSNIRMTYLNRTTNYEVLLNHWVQTRNNTDGVIWVKMPAMTANIMETIFMYFGNTAASDIGNGDDVFLFFDEFSGTSLNTTKWVSNEGNHNITTGTFQGNNGNEVDYIYTKEYSVPSDSIVEFRMRARTNAPGDWDTGIGVGTWGLVDDVNCGYCLGIDRNRWWNDITTSGVVRSQLSAFHDYRAWITDDWVALLDDTQGRSHNRTGTTSGPLYIIGDGDGNTNADAIFDWVFVRPAGPNASQAVLDPENVSFYENGNYTSSSLNTGSSIVNLGLIEVESTLPTNTGYQIYTRSSDDNTYWTDWEVQTDGNTITSEGKQYIEYLINFTSNQANKTPVIESVTIRYDTAQPSFSDMSATDTTFEAANPFDCGAIDSGDYCYPYWNTMTPKVRGKFNLRLHADGQGSCSYDEYSNEKIIYVFANTQINSFDSDEDPVTLLDTIILSGTLTTDLLTGIADKEIEIYLDSTYLDTVETESTGAFSYSYTFPNTTSIGSHTFMAIFRKDYEFYYMPSSAQTSVLVSSTPEVFNITFNPDPLGNTQTIQINSTVNDTIGISSVRLNITLPNGTKREGTMSNLSAIIWSYNFSETWAIGSYLVTVTATNDDGITASLSNTFTVEIYGQPRLRAVKENYMNNEDVLLASPHPWWNHSFAYRKPVKILNNHPSDALPTYYTVNVTLDTTGANFQDDGDDLRVVFWDGDEYIELDRINETKWNLASTRIAFRLQADITAGHYDDNYFIYYGSGGAGNPPANETHIYYFIERFNRADGTDLGYGWTEWMNGGTDQVNITSSRLSVGGNNVAPPDVGAKKDLELGSIPYNFQLSWYEDIKVNTEGDWLLQVALGDSSMTDSSYSTGVGPGIYSGEGDGMVGAYPLSCTVGSNLETGINGPQNFTLNVYISNYTLDYYRNSVLRNRSVSWANQISGLSQIRVYADDYAATSTNFEFDNILVKLMTTVPPSAFLGTETKSGIINYGTTPLSGYRWAVVQSWTSGAWADIYPGIILDYPTDLKEISAGSFLDYQTDWNTAPWNTGTYSPGEYRVKIALVKNISSPESDEAVIEDSAGDRLEEFFNFTILESILTMTDLTHYHLENFSINEYETTDTIEWINITVRSTNNTAFSTNVTMTLLDSLGIDYAGFGPLSEKKNYGTITVNTSKVMRWDNSTNGYYVPLDIISGSYNLSWNVSLVTQNGPELHNESEFVRIHNMPTNFTTTDFDRLYKSEHVIYNFTLANLWSQKITNVTVTLNCPAVAGLFCNCSGNATNICYLLNTSAGTPETASFNISANSTVESGDYIINFTLNYTNPANNMKSWQEIMVKLLEIRERGILEIVDYYHNETATRGGLAYFFVYGNNTNGTVTALDSWLNYTVVPSNWTNLTGRLDVNDSEILLTEVLWNNVTFLIGDSADLGPQTVLANSSSSTVKPDFRSFTVTVYANTSVSQYLMNDSNASRGETVKLTASLVWDNSSNMYDERVYFYDETDGVLIGSALINSSGVGSVNYMITSSASTGRHTLNATYLGKASIYSNPSNRTAYLDIGSSPVFNSITDSPDPVGYGYNATIIANVTDDDGLTSINAYIRYPNGTWYNSGMSLSSGLYVIRFNDTWTNGTYQYYLTATDVTGSMNVSSTYTFLLETYDTIEMETNSTTYFQFEDVGINGTSMPWWNESFRYRKSISVTNNLAADVLPKHFTANFSIDTTGTKFQDDGDDLRVVYWNGSVNREIDRINLTAFNSATTKVAFMIQANISAGDTDEGYYAYYGNSTVSNPPANESDIYFFAERFNRADNTTIGNGWTEWKTAAGADQVNITGYELRVGGNSADPPDVGIYQNFSHGDIPMDFEISWDWDIKVNTDGNWLHHVGIGKGGTMQINSYSNGVGPGLYAGEGEGMVGVYPIARAVGSNLEAGINGAHTIKLIVDLEAENYDYYRDDTLKTSDVSFVASQSELDSIRIYSDDYLPAGEDIEYDNIILKLRAATAPTVTVGSEVPQVNFRGHMIMTVERYDSGSWTHVETQVNDTDTGIFRSVLLGDFDLDSIWVTWNTGASEEGTYRVNARLVSRTGSILQGKDGLIQGYANFTILPPEINVTIEAIRVYQVTSATRYSGGTLIDSGLNKTFSFFVNYSYRIEIETKNQPGSSDWNLSYVNVSHTGLNESWNLSQVADIWYKIGAGSNVYNGSFNSGNLTWNTSTGGGLASANTLVTFYYAINLTPDTTVGDYNAILRAVDPTFEETDSSIFHVIVETADSPKLYNSTYGITLDELIRVFNTTDIYARWDSEIDEARAYFNATVSGIIFDPLTLPSPNTYNWTNYTFSPTSSWLLGVHVARITAKNPSDVWNTSLSFLNFSVYGLAYMKNATVNDSEISIGDPVTVKCNVEDDTNDLPVSSYNVSVYSNGVLVNWSLTNSTGWIQYEYTPASYGIYTVICNITEQRFYKTDSRRYGANSVFVKEFDPPKYHDVSGPTLAHKMEYVTLRTRWTDNAGVAYAILATNASGTMTNVSSMALSSSTDAWANISYQIPSSFTPGILGWQQYGNDTSDNYNVTPLQTIEVWGWSKVTSADVTPSSVMFGSFSSATCQVTDGNSSSAIQSYNVSFYRGSTYLGWNITNSSGWAKYRFNTSPIGTYYIKCNITDDAAKRYNNTLRNTLNDTLTVVDSTDVYPPKALQYGINDTSLYYTECVKIYARWNESLNYSKAMFNMTGSFTESYVWPPYTNNWTNKTICTNSSWTVGTHAIKLWANDSEGNINDTLSYKYFNITARSGVWWISPTGTMSRSTLNLTCRVLGNYTGTGISGYNVNFYGPSGYLGTSVTDSSGYAKYLVNLFNYGIGTKSFSCQISSKPFYTVLKASDSETLTFIGGLNVTIDNPVSGARLYRGQRYFLNSTTRDDNNSIVSVLNISWKLSNLTKIGNTTDANYTVSLGHPLGAETINASVNRSHYASDTVGVGIYIWTYAKINDSTLSPPIVQVNETSQFRCHIIDNATSDSLSGMTVSFYNGTTLFATNTTGADGWASRNLNYSTTGNRNLSCRVTDQLYINDTLPNLMWETLSVTSVGLSVDILSVPTQVFIGDNGVNITVNVSNIGDENLSNVNVTLSIPYNWSLVPGNASKVEIGNLFVFNWTIVSWYFNIGMNASTATQTINITGNSTENYDDYVSASIDIGYYDIACTNITLPANNSCETATIIRINATIRNNAENLTNIPIVVEVNNTVINISYVDLDTNESVNVSVLWKPMTEGVKLIEVYANHSQDTVHANDLKSIIVTKYFPRVMAYLTLGEEGEEINGTIFLRNEISCSQDDIRWYYFMPKGFQLGSSSLQPSDNLSRPTGVAYFWERDFSADEWINMSIIIFENESYRNFTNLNQLGLDPG